MSAILEAPFRLLAPSPAISWKNPGQLTSTASAVSIHVPPPRHKSRHRRSGALGRARWPPVQLSAYDRQTRLAPRCRAMRVGSGATALDRIERLRAIPAKFDGLTLVID
jgi:hypothetical protein